MKRPVTSGISRRRALLTMPYVVFGVFLGLAWLVPVLANQLGPAALVGVLAGVTLGPALVFVRVTLRRQHRANEALSALWDARIQAEASAQAHARFRRGGAA